jgi:lipopolysaccharide export system protein LptA
MKRLYAQILALIGRSLVSAAMLGAADWAYAEQNDRKQPTHVESDSLRYDDLKQTTEFIGHVVLTQGTLTLRADRLILRQDPDGYQFGQAQGRPAQFRQKRDALDEWIEGEAQTLDYDGRTETMTLSQQARVRRRAGTRIVDEIEGARIVYDARYEQFQVDGSRTPATKGPTQGRVRVIIQPRIEPSAPSTPSARPALRAAPVLP